MKPKHSSYVSKTLAVASQFLAIVTAIICVGLFSGTAKGQQPQFTTDFRCQDCRFRSTGTNPYMVNLMPGSFLVLEGVENGEEVRLEVNVLSEIRRLFVPGIGKVSARVVREKHFEGGVLVERSLNYFAICQPTNDVVYFGEDVDIFHPDGTVTHDGAWLAGAPDANGLAEPGIIMPGTFLLGARYFQEIAEGIAMDRAEHTQMGVQVFTKAGTFNRCVKTSETSPLFTGVSLKTFCPGVGLVQDGPLELVEFGGDDDD